MPVSRVFGAMSRTLARDQATGHKVVVTIDAVEIPWRAIFTRRQLGADVENQRFVTAAPAIALSPVGLPRTPKNGDTIRFVVDGETWAINGAPEDYSGGMLEWPVKRVTA